MGIFRISQKGNFYRTSAMLKNASKVKAYPILVKYGKLGVEALRNATPKDTGKTADSWYYKIREDADGSAVIDFCNSNISDGAKVAVLIQYGHASQVGAWVTGTDYINPALKPIFDGIATAIWKEVTP